MDNNTPDPKKLEKLPRRTIRKKMADPRELEERFKKSKHDLSLDEERLLDLLTFQKTGKHIGRFKDKKEPKKTSKKKHKLTFVRKDPLDPNTIVDDTTQDIIEKRIALRASQGVS